MLDKLEKILNKINVLLELLALKSKEQIKSITPDKISDSLNDTKERIQKAKKKVQTVKGSLKNKGSVALSKGLEFKKKGKENLNELKAKAKAFKPKEDLPKAGLALLALLAPYYQKFQGWLVSLKPTTIMALTVSGTMVGLGGIQAYKMSEEKDSTRRVSSIKIQEEESIKKPPYHNLNKKIFEVPNVKMPVYIESASSMKSLYMDLAFRGTNRYIAAYFLLTYGVNQRLILDKINSSVEPIIPTFPLNDEGKRIIKVKVMNDVNELLKELGIKGEVDEVYIKNILAG